MAKLVCVIVVVVVVVAAAAGAFVVEAFAAARIEFGK